MKLNLKTLNNKNVTVDVDMNCWTVSDLLTAVEDQMGQDSMYRIIYAGKLLQEDNLLSNYNIVGGKLPVILMVTKITSLRNPNHKPPMSLINGGAFKRIRTESEDSGFGDSEIDDKDDIVGHYVTDWEFNNALNVIKKAEYFNIRDHTVISRVEMINYMNVNMNDEQEDQKVVKKIIMERLHLLDGLELPKQKFEALVCDIHSIYTEVRNIPQLSGNEVSQTKGVTEGIGYEHEEDAVEEEDKVMRLTNMGFSEEEAINALIVSFNNINLAIDYLLPKEEVIVPSTSQNNPLDFLRDNEEFQFLRYQVLQDPKVLLPLLITFSQTHPSLMDIINDNKEIFIRMIHEQTGAKRQGRH